MYPSLEEIWEIIQEKWFGFNRQVGENTLEKVRVRDAIIRMCEEHLYEAADVFVFEIFPNSLPYAVSVLDDPILASRYTIVQISETLFEARMVILKGL